jgi:hypothetical protein
MPYHNKDHRPDYPSIPSDTSEAATEAVDAPKAAALRERIYDFILNAGARGATDEEIQDHLDIPGNTQRPRRWELSHKQDRIKPTGETRKTHTGRYAVVWTINPTPGLKEPKTTPPKQVWVTYRRGGSPIRRFKSFVTEKGNAQVVTFPQEINCLAGDTVEISVSMEIS